MKRGTGSAPPAAPLPNPNHARARSQPPPPLHNARPLSQPDGAPDPPWTTPGAAPTLAAASPSRAATAAASAAAATPFPPPPLGEFVLDLTCALSPREAWRLIAAAASRDSLTSPLDTAFAAARGDTGLTATPWTVHHPKGRGGGDAVAPASPSPTITTIRTRRVQYTTPLKRTWLGPASAACDAVWACGTRGEAGWAITQTVHTPGVPFGDCFHTQVLIVAADVTGSGVGGGDGTGTPPAAPLPPLPPPSSRSRGRPLVTSMTASSSSSVAAGAAAAPASHPPAKGSRPGSAASPSPSPSPSPAKKGRGGPPPRLTRLTVSGAAVFTSPIALPGVRALIAKSTADGLRESYALYGGLLAARAAASAGTADGRRGGRGKGRRAEMTGDSSGELLAAAAPGGGRAPPLVEADLLARQPPGAAATAAAAAALALAVAAAAVAVASASATAPGHAWLEAATAAASHAAAVLGEAIGW